MSSKKKVVKSANENTVKFKCVNCGADRSQAVGDVKVLHQCFCGVLQHVHQDGTREWVK